MNLAIVVAMTEKHLIGNNGQLPGWHLRDDMEFFKRLTKNQIVIMGRKTWESLPDQYRPLPERTNVVITSKPDDFRPQYRKNPYVYFFESFEEALSRIGTPGTIKVFVIGGAQVYQEALPQCDDLYITWVDAPELTGDTYFPFFKEEEWEEQGPVTPISDRGRNSHKARIVHYRRKEVEPVLADLTYAKDPEYKDALHSFVDQGECPLCPKKFQSGEYHTNPMLREEGGWVITRNMTPYANAQEHFLLVPARHMVDMSELLPNDFQSIQRLVQLAQNEYGFAGGALVVRFGDTRYTGATVSHLHFHLIVPELDAQTQRATPVYFPIG